MNPALLPVSVAAVFANERQRRQEELEAKVERWNAESAKKPGAKVRIYRVLSDGCSIGIEDRERGV